jgi:DNA (cytosine-5)-methyltransferase 1
MAVSNGAGRMGTVDRRRVMRCLSLFSGIGGLDLAAEWAGIETVAFCERDKYCQRVLAKHWPGVTIHDDITTLSGLAYTGIDIIHGGFPCQPHSIAGKRKASGDDRDLWGECRRIVGEARPTWAVFENVQGLLTSENGNFFYRVTQDLASLGYAVGWCVYGACDVGARHKRERVFIFAYASSPRLQGRAEAGNDGKYGSMRGYEFVAGSGRVPRWVECEASAGIRRVAHGIPNRVDRLKSLGNAVVPQQAYPIFSAIVSSGDLV